MPNFPNKQIRRLFLGGLLFTALPLAGCDNKLKSSPKPAGSGTEWVASPNKIILALSFLAKIVDKIPKYGKILSGALNLASGLLTLYVLVDDGTKSEQIIQLTPEQIKTLQEAQTPPANPTPKEDTVSIDVTDPKKSGGTTTK